MKIVFEKTISTGEQLKKMKIYFTACKNYNCNQNQPVVIPQDESFIQPNFSRRLTIKTIFAEFIYYLR